MRNADKIGRRPGRRGNAVIEFSLLVPWILLLFASVLDFGFYSYALILTENAARAATLRTAHPGLTLANATAAACGLALAEMKALPNARNLTSCPSVASGPTDTSPLAVTAVRLDGKDGRPTGIDGRPAMQITIAYLTVPMFPLPGIAGRLKMTRTVEMRIGEDF